MGEVPIGFGLIFWGLGQLNCICVLKFKVGALSFQVYDCVKSDNIFSHDIFSTFLSAECFSCFFLSQASMADFEIITFNVKSLGSYKKRRKSLRCLLNRENLNSTFSA